MEASALSQQVENIARSLAPNSNKDEVTTEHRKLALATLVELKRLEQLRAIAESKTNSTYFFGDKAAGLGSPNEAFNIDYAQNVKAGVLDNGKCSRNASGNSPITQGAIF